MTRPRKALVSLGDTAYYHCVARCVRRAFLCGFDQLTARSFEHRRGWIVERIKTLSAIFAIDVAAYAVMSNHFHLVLHIDSPRANTWSSHEVFERWSQLFDGSHLVRRFLAGETLLDAEQALIERLCQTYRERLVSLSWFMRCLNEPIARWANAEDGCTGRFWEGRFKSQALLDETALLTCMAYVDLNPVRAGIATAPEDSDYTSIQERIADSVGLAHSKTACTSEPTNSAASTDTRCDTRTLIQPAELLPFRGDTSLLTDTLRMIDYRLTDYIDLVDWTGRVIRCDKRGAIDAALPPILQRLGIAPETWLDSTKHYRKRFSRAVGPVAALQAYCRHLGGHWLHGKRACAMLYPDPSPA